MRKGRKKLIAILKQAAVAVRAGSTPDGRILNDAEITLGRAIREISSIPPTRVELLALIRQALQMIAQGGAPELSRLSEAMNNALAVAIQGLQFDDAAGQDLLMQEATETLRRKLEGPCAAASGGDDPGGARLRGSLDDLAAFIVQLEPYDIPGLARLQMMFHHVAAQAPSGSPVGPLAVEASMQIDDLLRGAAPDPAALLAAVGRLIEAAALAAEKTVGPTAPAPDEIAGWRLPDAPVLSDAPPASAIMAPIPAAASKECVPAPVAEALPPDTDLSLLADFITESREYIEGAEAALLALETNPDAMEAVNTAFRAFHTIKGTSAFLGLTRLTELAHRAESLLSRVRDREIRCTGGYADLALRSIDSLKALLQVVQDAMGGVPMHLPDGYDDLMARLQNPEAAGISEEPDDKVGPVPRLGDLMVAMGLVTREDAETVAVNKGDQPLGMALLKSQVTSVTEVAQALRTQQQLGGSDRTGDASVRVRTDRLDRLIDMVGELVIAHSMIAQDAIVLNALHHELSRKVTHTGKIVRELQDLSMSMRMVPLKATFQKMARLVRDLAYKSGKLIEFSTEGEDTEIDRHMVDIINDPLVHMVRNAVDHGIETPDGRTAQGKSKTGAVRLRAFHAGGNVVVELQDDGRGLDREKIIRKALAKGLLDSDKGLSDREVFNLIFAPGFSTADQVTDVSGRGVGMDVVRRNVEALRGRIDIVSEAGKGSMFSIQLPLTLAITDGMLVKVGSERYIVPIINISLSFRPTDKALFTIAERGEMVMLRDDLMPMFRLHRLFHVNGAMEDPTQALLVVVGDGDRRCALLVDELLGQQQVVAKSLGNGLGKVLGITGGAILGDGRVGLILDAAEIVRLARQAPSGRGGGGALRRSAA